jgi:hypothetical protein
MVSCGICHTCISKENQLHNYMYVRIYFHTYSGIKVNTEIVSRKKKGDYQSFTLNPRNEGTEHLQAADWACVRLALATSSQ